jgi:hypothetical protein
MATKKTRKSTPDDPFLRWLVGGDMATTQKPKPKRRPKASAKKSAPRWW